MQITLLHNGEHHKLEIELSDGVEILRLQIFSLTSVPPDEQEVTGIGPGILRDDADLATLGVLDGTWVLLNQKRALPTTQAPQPAGAVAETLARRAKEERARQQMEGRLSSGFQTGAMHDDKALQAQARALIPWETLCASARAAREAAEGAAVVAPRDDVDHLASALSRMLAQPQLVRLAEATRQDAGLLQPMLVELSASSPALIELIRENQPDFQRLLNGERVHVERADGRRNPEWELKELLRWFKQEFFTWVNEPPCEVTGEATQNVRRVGCEPRGHSLAGPSGPHMSATFELPAYD